MSLKKSVRKTKSGNRYNISALHGFRKYFNITMKSRHDCNLSLCEKLMGHSTTVSLDNSYTPFATEKIFEEYKLAILVLTISNDERYALQLQNKNKKLEELEQVKEDRLLLRAKLCRMENSTYTKKEVEEMFENFKKELKKK
jgi:hypothetical protein